MPSTPFYLFSIHCLFFPLVVAVEMSRLHLASLLQSLKLLHLPPLCMSYMLSMPLKTTGFLCANRTCSWKSIWPHSILNLFHLYSLNIKIRYPYPLNYSILCKSHTFESDFRWKRSVSPPSTIYPCPLSSSTIEYLYPFFLKYLIPCKTHLSMILEVVSLDIIHT